MDISTLLIDSITTIITSLLTVTLVAALPLIQAWRKEKIEAKESTAKTSILGAEALEKMAGAFGNIQDFYAEALNIANSKVTELREEVKRLKKIEDQLPKMESMAEQIVEITTQLVEKKVAVKEYKKRERRWKEIAKTLSDQIKKLDEVPEATFEDLLE